MANRFSVDKIEEKKSIWSNPTTPLDVSQFKNEPIKSTTKPLDLKTEPRTPVAKDVGGTFLKKFVAGGFPRVFSDEPAPETYKGAVGERFTKAKEDYKSFQQLTPDEQAQRLAFTFQPSGSLSNIGNKIPKGKVIDMIGDTKDVVVRNVKNIFNKISKTKDLSIIARELETNLGGEKEAINKLATRLQNVSDPIEVAKIVNENSNLNIKTSGNRFDINSPKDFLYRGQPEQFKDVQKVAQSDVVDNILIGRGIFTTTDESIAKSYGPNVFRFEKPTGKIFDLTKASEEDLRKILPNSFFEERRLGGLIHRPDDTFVSTYKTYKDAIKNGDIKDAEDILFESMADKYLPENITWEEVKGGATAVSGKGPLVDIVRDNLLKDLTDNGFDWMKHQGGIRAGTKKHDVYIALKDEVLKQSTTPEKPQPLFSGSQKLATQEASIPAEDFLLKLDQPSVIEKVPSKSYKDTIPKISEDVYKQNRSVGSSKRTWMKATKENIGSIKQGTSKLFAPISTRLKNLNIKLKQEMRKFEYNLSQETTKDNNAITPFIKKMKKLSDSDQLDLDLALKNRDVSKVDEIIKENGLEKEFTQVRKTLDDIHKRANDIGIEVNYFKNYFPREVANPTEFLNYLEETYGWKEIDQAIKDKEEELGRYLNVNEKAAVADDYIAPKEKVLIQTGAMKPRTIDFIGSDLNRFYKDSRIALNNYIQTMNDAIESWKFFNLGTKANKFTTVDSSIGNYVLKKIENGTITPTQSVELENILKSRFKDVGTSGIVSLYKNLSYIDTMGSPISAITQVGDLGFAIYRTGPIATTKEGLKSLFGKSEIKREDIGIEKIAQEFNDTGATARALDFVFKATGLQKIDAIGKETLINSIINKYRKQALNPTPDFMRRITDVFGDETPQLLNDLKSGEVTENIKYLAFNELLDIQPLKLSEMPEQYLKGGNGRIFYMLKTYTIKLFDVYRNEVFQEMKRNKLRGIKNLIYLTSSLVLANATADEIKDFVLGRETSLKDRTVDNLLRLAGFTKWTIYKARMEGLASATIKTILPPTKFLDSLYKDITQEKEVRDMETIQSIPFIGKLYYWWFGKGSTKGGKKKETTGNRF